MAYQPISAAQVDKESPNDATLMGTIKDNFDYLYYNAIYGGIDFTYGPTTSAGYTETALGADGSYIAVSKLILLPAPPTGKKWRIKVRFYLGRNGGIDRDYTVQIWDYEASSAVSAASVTHTGNDWIDHYLYATTAWTRRYLRLKIDPTGGYYWFRRPSVTVDLVSI